MHRTASHTLNTTNECAARTGPNEIAVDAYHATGRTEAMFHREDSRNHTGHRLSKDRHTESGMIRDHGRKIQIQPEGEHQPTGNCPKGSSDYVSKPHGGKLRDNRHT